ncbi:MAG: methyltransferase domain-containing protein [Pseudomonadota bacterium]
MDKAEFDKFASEYEAMHRQNIRLSGEAPDFFAQYKIADIRREWDRAEPGREPEAILDFGGGIGSCAPHFRHFFPETPITLADVSERSLEIAVSRRIEGLTCVPFDGQTLPLPDQSQDLAFAACVFHHVPAEAHIALMREIRRVMKPGGLFFVFEHNPWNPLTVHAVNNCPFDENAVLIPAPVMRGRVREAGWREVALSYRIFFPGPLAALRPLERGMTWLPIGAQYYTRARA